MPRTRTQTGPPLTGRYWYSLANAYVNTTASTYRYSCNDEVGYPTPHDLGIDKRWNEPERMMGSSPGIPNGFEGTVVPSAVAGFKTVNHLVGGIGSAARVRALTNPSRPVVDLPVFVKELKDLPKLIQLAGRNILSKPPGGTLGFNPNLFKNRSPLELVGSGNLNWQFGWAPLLGDLLKLTGFMDHVAKRQLELQKLYSGKGLRRRVNMGSLEQNGTIGNTTLNSVGFALNGAANVVSKSRSWGTVKWFPTTLPDINDPTHVSAAIKATLGLDLTMSTVWEALPWTWLIDWFTNVGDILMGSRNTVPAHHGPICFMTYQKTVESWYTTGITSGLSWGGTKLHRETKQRTVVNTIQVTGDIPFLGWRRLSILGSLAVLRAAGWRQRA